MQQIVQDLIQLEGVVGIMIVSRDGFVVSSALLEDEDAEVLGAMSAVVFSKLGKATEHNGEVPHVDTIIDSQGGSILVLELGELALIVIARHTADLDLIKQEMQQAAEQISNPMLTNDDGLE
jgi:hypothetical protein